MSDISYQDMSYCYGSHAGGKSYGTMMGIFVVAVRCSSGREVQV